MGVKYISWIVQSVEQNSVNFSSMSTDEEVLDQLAFEMAFVAMCWKTRVRVTVGGLVVTR